MWPLFVTVFGASLVGSVHCAGMCGGFVAFYAGSEQSGAGRRSAWARLWPHVLYNGGRLVTYGALGAIAGAAGAGLDLAGEWAGVHRAAAAVAGGLIVIWGGLGLLRSLGVRLPPVLRGAGALGPLRRLLGRVTASLRQRSAAGRAWVLGVSSTLLPCGWLYAYVATAASTGSPWLGMWTMLAFWLGTLPALLALGASAQRLSGPLRRYVPSLTSLALVVVGLWAVFGKVSGASLMNADGPGGSAVPACHEQR